MKNYFPPKNTNTPFLQTNRSNVLGSLWSTFNLDFQSNLGVIRIAQKLVTNTTSSDDADLGLPSAFEYFDDRWWASCGTRIFKNSNDTITSTFTEDASSGATTSYDANKTDLAVFDDRLWSTANGKLYSKASGSGTGAWTDRTSTASLTASTLQLCYFKRMDKLYFINTRQKIGSIDAANTVYISGDYSIDLGESVGIITCIDKTSNYIYIGTMGTSNSSTGNILYGSIFQWDGISAQPNAEYILPTGGVLAMTVSSDIPYVIDSEGRVLKNTGYNFEEIGRLPIDRTLLTGANSSSTSDGRFVHFNGMQVTKNNTILVGINNLNDNSTGSINENLPSGIWELDLATGNFTHRYSFSLQTMSSTPVDFGQNRILSIGAIKVNPFMSSSSSGRGTLLAGSGYYTTATATSYGIFIDSPVGDTSDDEGQKRGYHVSTWYWSKEVADAWDEVWTTFRQFQNSTDSISFKYRITEEDPIEATITWTSTTTFTTTTNPSAYWTSGTGGEVEIIQGTGSGACAHIIGITGSGTYTVTLDEAITGVSGTAKARFQKWTKVYPKDTLSTLSNWGQFTINTDSTPRIQIKCCLVWTGDGEFYKYILNSNEDIKS